MPQVLRAEDLAVAVQLIGLATLPLVLEVADDLVQVDQDGQRFEHGGAAQLEVVLVDLNCQRLLRAQQRRAVLPAAVVRQARFLEVVQELRNEIQGVLLKQELTLGPDRLQVKHGGPQLQVVAQLGPDLLDFEPVQDLAERPELDQQQLRQGADLVVGVHLLHALGFEQEHGVEMHQVVRAPEVDLALEQAEPLADHSRLDLAEGVHGREHEGARWTGHAPHRLHCLTDKLVNDA
mmetsp:Transcript_4948/g.14893  ORF Transcript_4948/g.14893 Transcript_4948/m.14893 type:complete len:235 (-) Transcript_4948:300-1004(-)